MRVVLQRVHRASVRVDGETLGEIGRGGVVLVGIGTDDDAAIVDRMADKVAGLRYFTDASGRTTASLDEVGGALLVVSQFTLYADLSKGRRPSWSAAAPRAVSEPLVEAFVEALRQLGAEVATGAFGAEMQVSLVNDGPVTLVIDSDNH